MFPFAIITILFGYSFFFLGILHILFSQFIIVDGIFYILIVSYLVKKNFAWDKDLLQEIKRDRITLIVSLLLLVLTTITFIGVLGPETSFDALWYHLTLPKLYLQQHALFFIPGGVLYYSSMPKLGELLFIPALFFGGEIMAKATQFLFSILTMIVLYKISRKYVSVTLSLVACLIFYSNIVVSWEATVGYIDVIRAFFEVMAFYSFVLWVERKSLISLVFLGIMIGGAMMTKILAISSLCIFIFLIIYNNWKNKKPIRESLLDTSIISIVSIITISPWLIFSYIYTGNPVYPFFTAIYKTQVADNAFSFHTFFLDLFKIFLFSDDPISPLYLIIVPLLVFSFNHLSSQAKMVAYYCIGAFIFWYLTPRTGGGRFILPYLPLFSLLVVLILNFFKKNKIISVSVYFAIFIIASTTIVYRGIANARVIPVVLGIEQKSEYLSKHLNFSYGDFYDTDGYFAQHIKSSDIVLLYGFHNFYYIDFPFIDSSWVKKGDTFTYIATQNTNLPKRFSNWKLIYQNKKTGVKLYNKKTIWSY